MPRRPGTLIGVLAAVALAASACGSSAGTSEPAASATPSVAEPTATAVVSATATPAATAAPLLVDTTYRAGPAGNVGGVLTIGGWEWPDVLLPYFARYGYDLQLASSMFDGLLKVTPGLRYLPNLVTSVPTLDNGGVALSGGGMDVTWELRPGMRWSDGQAITCDDIRATWEWVMDPANHGLATGTAGWQDVTGVDGGSGTHCVMHFRRVYEGYLSLVDPLLPAHYLTSVPVAQSAAKLYSKDDLAGGVYSGPYVPVSVTGRSEIAFKPNPEYATISGHAPYLAGLQWKFFGDPMSMVAAYNAGTIAFAQDLTETDLTLVRGLPAADTVATDSSAYELLAFNDLGFSTKYGADGANIIRALELAIDRTALVDALPGGVSVTDDFVSPLSWYYKSYRSSVSLDLTSAQALLANMGWRAGSDGILTREGHPLALDLCTTPRGARPMTLTQIADQLKKIGVKATVHLTAAPTMFGTWAATKVDAVCSLAHGNFDIAEFAYVSSVDPSPGYATYASSQSPEDSAGHTGQNFSRVHNSTLDQAYATIMSTVDPAKIQEAMAAVQGVYASDQNTFELPLYFHKDLMLVSPKLHNVVGGSSSLGPTWNVGDWWLS